MPIKENTNVPFVIRHLIREAISISIDEFINFPMKNVMNARLVGSCTSMDQR